VIDAFADALKDAIEAIRVGVIEIENIERIGFRTEGVGDELWAER
jgi:hypothetical protein